MIISVLGATGATGQHFLRQALEAGHTVRALVRNAAKLDAAFQAHENLIVVPDIDIFSVDSLEKGFDGVDAVVSCLGTRPTLMPWGQEITFHSESIKPIVDAMRKCNVGRIVAMTSMFTDDDPSYGFFVRWILKPLFIGRNLDDMARMENFLEEQCQGEGIFVWEWAAFVSLESGHLQAYYRGITKSNIAMKEKNTFVSFVRRELHCCSSPWLGKGRSNGSGNRRKYWRSNCAWGATGKDDAAG